MKKGRVYWVTGLSDSGKTTISNLLYEHMHKEKNNLVWIDGDKIREVYQNTDYSEIGRRNISYTNMRLCKLLSDQGIDVIISVIGMKDEYREWNRDNFEFYTEIYLEVPIDVLIKRDSKGLYGKALRGEICNVYGIDMEFEEPKSPDIRVVNDGEKSPEEVCRYILEQMEQFE